MKPIAPLSLLLALALSAAAQDTPTFRAESRMSVVHFHVIHDNQYVGGVKVEDVILTEDGSPKEIKVFEGGKQEGNATPLEIILLFDQSGSVMNAGLLNPVLFRQKLIDGVPNVTLSVYGFDTKLRKYGAPTRDFEKLTAAFDAVQTRASGAENPLSLFPKRKAEKGGTWLYEAIAATAEDSVQQDATRQDANVTRMMMVFSDGLSTTTAEAEDGAGVANDLGIQIYAVVLGHEKVREAIARAQAAMRPNANSGPSAPMNRRQAMQDSKSNKSMNAANNLAKEQAKEKAIERFASLGELTGGRAFDPPQATLDVMQRILDGIVVLARSEYVAGYVPDASTGKPRKHKVAVRLRSDEIGKVVGGVRSVTY